jgi:hypothetical protein
MLTATNVAHFPTSLLIVLDVDGVSRHDITGCADPIVIAAVRALIADERADPIGLRATFLSGSHSIATGEIEDWRRPNLSLSEAFSSCFPAEDFHSGYVRVMGQLGSDICDVVAAPASAGAATPHGDPENGPVALAALEGRQMEAFPDTTRLTLLRVLLTQVGDLFLRSGNFTEAEHSEYATLLEASLAAAAAQPLPVDRAPDALEPVSAFIRRTCDPKFRLISHGANAEIGVRPTRRPIAELRERARLEVYHGAVAALAAAPDPAVAALKENMSAGVAVQDGHEFLGALVSLSTKGRACAALISEEVANGAAHDALTLLTVGDSMIDYPMHRLAHAAFHVGPLSTWKAMRADPSHQQLHQHVVHVAPDDGNLAEQALLNGTVRVLTRLRAALQTMRVATAGMPPAERRAKVREAVTGVAEAIHTPSLDV